MLWLVQFFNRFTCLVCSEGDVPVHGMVSVCGCGVLSDSAGAGLKAVGWNWCSLPGMKWCPQPWWYALVCPVSPLVCFSPVNMICTVYGTLCVCFVCMLCVLCVYVYMYVCRYVCMNVCMYVWVCARVCVCTCIRTCVCTWIEKSVRALRSSKICFSSSNVRTNEP